ncbi:MAG: hypothetical protein WD533_02505 [Dehalococcoidia bacterium]
MGQIVGIYTRQTAADAAQDLLMDAGYLSERVRLLRPRGSADEAPLLRLNRRGESMVRMAVRWGIIGALITEVPLVIVLLFLPIDVNAKVLMASTVWKFGAAFGAWLGVMAASERGLEADEANRYEELLNQGNWILSADVRAKHRPFARGAMVESDAVDVSDVRGTFELKPQSPQRRVTAHG